ncbi:MAG TPA: hypothetical protein VMO78_17295 [Rhizomicrobium sp.]|nr:hypothetical protein [Rhizomicrobium sp.]
MNVFRSAAWSTAIAIFAIWPAQAQPANDYPPAWPRPGATLLVDNDRGAAWNVVYAKDKPTPMHRHRYFFAGLDLNTATIRVTQPDGKSGLHPVVKNRMWYLPRDLTHQEMSTTEPGRHTVVIDIKEKSIPEATNSTDFPTDKYAPYQEKIVDNDRVTIWDCAWSPGADGVTSFDSRDMFLAFAEGGDLSIAVPGQPAKVQHYDSGQAIFLPGGQSRKIGSAGGTIHAMLVEVK